MLYVSSMSDSWKLVWYRLLYLLSMFYLIVALGSTLLGVLLFLSQGPLLLPFAGAINLLIASAFFKQGRLHYGFDEMDTTFSDPEVEEGEGGVLDSLLNVRIQELHELENRLVLLDRQRGDVGFDPWQLQQYRTQIDQLVEIEPRLRPFRRVGSNG
jgi:hypothetical protein